MIRLVEGTDGSIFRVEDMLDEKGEPTDDLLKVAVARFRDGDGSGWYLSVPYVRAMIHTLQ